MKDKATKQITTVQAYDRLEAQCARAEHCTWELRQKLWRWKILPQDAEAIIERLKKNRYVDDSRYAFAYVNDKARFARWGERKIRAMLMTKRIPADIINEAIAQLDTELMERNLVDIMEAKARTIENPRSYEGRTRLYRYAVSRGFMPDMIARIIRSHFV